MKSYHADSGAGLAGPTLKEHPEPKPGPHEVLVKVRVNSLNARELLVLQGEYPLPVKPDVVMGPTARARLLRLAMESAASPSETESLPRCSHAGSRGALSGNMLRSWEDLSTA
jgi:hypothetical protein